MATAFERKERSIEFLRVKDNIDLSVEHKRVIYAPLHAHNYFELEIVLCGEGVEFLNGVEYSISRGSLCLMNPSDFHEIRPGSDVEMWNIGFSDTMVSPDLLDTMYSGFFGPRNTIRKMSERETETLHNVATLIQEEFDGDGLYRPLIDYLLRRVLRNNQIDTSDSPIRKAIGYIETHFREDPSLGTVADHVCLSPVYFGALFKQVCGMSYVKYLNQRKINCAKMLLETGVSVTTACFSSGFGSMSGFLYTFKQVTGASPKVYRDGCRFRTAENDLEEAKLERFSYQASYIINEGSDLQ